MTPTTPTPDPIDGNEFLDAGQRQRLHDLVRAPEQHMDALRADAELQRAIARADVMPQLAAWFKADLSHGDGGWAAAPERSGPVGQASACVVAWSFQGIHTQEVDPSPIEGALPLDQEITLQGVTFMGVEDGAFLLRRYVDWAGLYAQLGFSLNWRTPHSAGRWRHDRRGG